jgi:hypothetical protein
MSTGAPDPLTRDPERLRIVATLAALPDGDALSVTRLQDMIRLPPGGLITCLRELGRAGYGEHQRLSKIPGPSAVAPARMATTALFGPAPTGHADPRRDHVTVCSGPAQNHQPGPPGRKARLPAIHSPKWTNWQRCS